MFLWAAVRFGTGGVSAALLGFAFVVIWSVAHGQGPFAATSPLEATLPIQLFLTLLAAPMLLLAALVQERQGMESALAERESQYRSIVESTGDGVLVTDLTNAVVAVNPAFCTITGYSAEQLRTLHPASSCHFDDLQPFDAYLARTAAADVVTAGVLCVCANARLTRLELRGKRFSYGGHVHVLSVVRDVTEREHSLRLLEQKVAERTRELSTLLEISNTVASNLQLKPLLRVVLEQLQIVLGCTGVSVFVIEGDELVILDHRGPLADEVVASARLPGRQMIACVQERNGSPLIVDNLWGDSDAARAFRDRAPEALTALLMHARSLLLVPLRVRDRTIGFLLLDNHEPDRFSTRDGTLAWALANQAAVAIENARLYGHARELAAFEERQRLARDLHDSVTQSLYTAAMLGRALPGAWESDQKLAREMLAPAGRGDRGGARRDADVAAGAASGRDPADGAGGSAAAAGARAAHASRAADPGRDRRIGSAAGRGPHRLLSSRPGGAGKCRPPRLVVAGAGAAGPRRRLGDAGHQRRRRRLQSRRPRRTSGHGVRDHARAGRGNRRRSEDRQRHRPGDDRDAALARLSSRPTSDGGAGPARRSPAARGVRAGGVRAARGARGVRAARGAVRCARRVGRVLRTRGVGCARRVGGVRAPRPCGACVPCPRVMRTCRARGSGADDASAKSAAAVARDLERGFVRADADRRRRRGG